MSTALLGSAYGDSARSACRLAEDGGARIAKEVLGGMPRPSESGECARCELPCDEATSVTSCWVKVHTMKHGCAEDFVTLALGELEE